MSYYTELLNLPEEDALALANVYTGYAAALAGERRPEGDPEQLLPWRTSSLLLGALFTALVEPAAARPRFAEAAAYYRILGRNFWKAVAVCAVDWGLYEGIAETPRSPAARQGLGPGEAETLFYDLLAHAFVSVRRPDRLLRLHYLISQARAQHLRVQPVGRLGLPLGAYADALADSLEWNSNQAVVWRVEALLVRGAEPVMAAQVDTYNWQRLRGNIVPLEPEVLAACVALGARWLATGQPPGVLAARLESLDATARAPMEVALALLAT